jgi:hypothetical protein
MRLREEFQMTCLCGRDHVRPVKDRNFTCECGRKSLIDWAGVDTEQLYRKLNGADMVRDSLAREIENRRQKVA